VIITDRGAVGAGIEWNRPLPQLTTTVTATPSWGIAATGLPRTLTVPGTPVGAGDRPLFALSRGEFNLYFEGTNNAPNVDRVGRDEDGVARRWWLRSPHLVNNARRDTGESIQQNGGPLAMTMPGSQTFMRPALWITTN
jgi:hypothetical protein